MTPVREALEPCPFCGGRMEEVTDEDGHYWVHPGRKGMGRADCWLCDAWVSDEQTGEGSIGEWNTRASAAPGEPCAVKPLEWVEREGVSGTFDANTSIGHYIATITDDERGMWFIVGQTTSNYMIANISAVQRAAQADYEQRIRSALVTTPQPAAGRSNDKRNIIQDAIIRCPSFSDLHRAPDLCAYDLADDIIKALRRSRLRSR